MVLVIKDTVNHTREISFVFRSLHFQRGTQTKNEKKKPKYIVCLIMCYGKIKSGIWNKW